MFKKLRSVKKRVFVSLSIMALTIFSGVISASAAYTVQPIPSAQPIDFASVGDLWSFGASMMQDVIAIVSNQPILIAMLFALPLVGLGIGLFKRLVY